MAIASVTFSFLINPNSVRHPLGGICKCILLKKKRKKKKGQQINSTITIITGVAYFEYFTLIK